MATFVRMQQRSLTEESAILAKWYVAEGDVVKEGQHIYALETGKATFDVEAEVSGTILKILASEGDEVPVIKIICVIGNPGEVFVLPDEEGSKEDFTPKSKGAEKEDALSANSALPSAISAPPLDDVSRQYELKISPRARRLALAQGLDYNGLCGTGPGGRVLEEDVKAALAARPAEASIARIAGEAGEYTSVSHTHVRKVIAANMLSSLQNMAQFTIHAHCDVSEPLSYRERWNSVKTPDEKLSINDLVAFAVSRVLPKFPYLNAHFYEKETRLFAHVNLGIAVDTPRGLLVPTVRNADTKSLAGLSREIKTLAGRCHEGKAAPMDLADGTFTLSNIGAWGAGFFTPIINPPQTGILGVGAIEYRRKKTPSGMVDYPALALSLTIDHRAVDGAPATAFLKALCEGLEHFSLLLLV